MNQKEMIREFSKYVSQSVLSMLGISCYILADTFFIARGVGANGLTALNLAIPVFSVVNGCGLMFGMGSATKYAISKETEGQKKVDGLFTGTLWIAGFFALLFVLAGIFFSHPLTVLMGANEEVYDMVQTYLSIILIFSPAFIMNDVLNSFVRNDGNPSLSMTAMISGSMFNILFDYILIFPLHMGILGAVLATGIAPVVSMLVLSLHFWQKKNNFHLTKSRPDIKLVFSAAALGVPTLVSEIASGVVIAVFNMLILGLKGNIGVAAYGVIANLSIVVIAIYNGIGQGVQPLLSREYGRSRHDRVRCFLRYALITSFVVSVLMYAVIFFGATPIAGAFNNDGNGTLQRIAEEGLKLYFTAIPFVGCNIIIAMYFSSTDKALSAQVIQILRGLALIIPLACIFAKAAGIVGVWIAFPVTEIVVCLFAMIIFNKNK